MMSAQVHTGNPAKINQQDVLRPKNAASQQQY